MQYALNAQRGKVKYIMIQKGQPVGSETSVETAEWLLAQGKPFYSPNYDGYEIGVIVRGDEYAIAGVWHKDAPACERDYCEIAPQESAKPRRKRRQKDIVCE